MRVLYYFIRSAKVVHTRLVYIVSKHSSRLSGGRPTAQSKAEGNAGRDE